MHANVRVGAALSAIRRAVVRSLCWRGAACCADIDQDFAPQVHTVNSGCMFHSYSFKGKPGKAIIALSRRHFGVNALRVLLDGTVLGQQLFHNDVYSKVQFTTYSLPSPLCDVCSEALWRDMQCHCRPLLVCGQLTSVFSIAI